MKSVATASYVLLKSVSNINGNIYTGIVHSSYQKRYSEGDLLFFKKEDYIEITKEIIPEGIDLCAVKYHEILGKIIEEDKKELVCSTDECTFSGFNVF